MDPLHNITAAMPDGFSVKQGNGSVSTFKEKVKEDSKLSKACADFEAILLNYMFEAMRKTVGEGGIFGNSFQKNMYESMFDREVSTSLSKGRGIGIGQAFYRQITARNMDDNTESPKLLGTGISQEMMKTADINKK